MQIMTEPEDVQTIESTLLVLGVNDTTPLGHEPGCRARDDGVRIFTKLDIPDIFLDLM